MRERPDHLATRLATRLVFFVAGFGIACWAPLVPFAKQRLGVDEGVLGLLLLCIGIGSVIAMTLSGPLSARLGSRPVILASGFLLALFLPLLAIAATPIALGAALLLFGAALGSLDVAANVHAIEVEKDAGRPLMSGFHGFFSVGGFAGAGLMTLLLSARLDPFGGTLACALAMAALMALAWPRLLRSAQGADGPLFIMPRGIVRLLAIVTAATFLAEGAMLDWSALLITGAGFVRADQGGVGYMLFATAMTIGRFAGDAATARCGDRYILFWGGLLAVAGFVTLLAAPVPALALAGFVPIGLGAANIVPVLFRKAGTQTAMPAPLAIGAITTTGYAGILAGPAGIGFVADKVGLHAAFWMVAGLLCLVPLTAGVVAGRSEER